MQIKDNKDKLLEILAALHISTVNITYDGSGDSGQIGSPQARDDKQDIEVDAEKTMVTPWKGWGRKIKGAKVPPQDIIEEFAYKVLERVRGGWKINEGSYGNITIDVKAGTVNVSHETRIEDTGHSDYSI